MPVRIDMRPYSAKIDQLTKEVSSVAIDRKCMEFILDMFKVMYKDKDTWTVFHNSLYRMFPDNCRIGQFFYIARNAATFLRGGFFLELNLAGLIHDGVVGGNDQISIEECLSFIKKVDEITSVPLN